MGKITLYIKALLRWKKLGEFKDLPLEYYDQNHFQRSVISALTEDSFRNESYEKIMTLTQHYMAEELKNEFVQFLGTNDCYEDFCANLKNENSSLWREMCEKLNLSDIDEYLLKQSPKKYVLDAFQWTMSPQGDAKWREINNKWNNTIKEYLLGENYMIGRIPNLFQKIKKN